MLLDEKRRELKYKELIKLIPRFIAKSLIPLTVKPWDEKIDLDLLAKEILKIEMDGL